MHFVTFTTKLGAGGAEVAARVAEALGYKLYGREDVERLASEMGFGESVAALDEKPPSLFQRVFSHKPHIELDRLNSVIYELAERGDCVFFDQAAHVLLRSFECAMHVLLTASVRTRVRNLVETGYTEEGAHKAIEQSDHEHEGFLRFAFGLDWNNPETYDVVFNTDKIGVDLCVETAVAMARSGVIRACSIDALGTLARLALRHRVEAAIEEAGLSYGPETTVTVAVPEPGKVHLSGRVGDEAIKRRAAEVAKRVQGVEAVEDAIRAIPSDRHA